MKVKLLVVEDDAMIRNVLTEILPMYGDFEIVTAGDGVAALETLCGGFAPDVILTDLKMPRMDGRALLEALRGRGYGRPVVLMTGFVMGVDGAGFAAVVTKPFSMETLARQLAAFAAT